MPRDRGRRVRRINMTDQACMLVVGLDPLASAMARLLFLAGYAVALSHDSAPKVLRRRMSFADAWQESKATLDGVEARLVRSDAEFLTGLRRKSFIPLLTAPPAGAVERWPWDVIVDVRAKMGSAGKSTASRPCGLVWAQGPLPARIAIWRLRSRDQTQEQSFARGRCGARFVGRRSERFVNGAAGGVRRRRILKRM